MSFMEKIGSAVGLQAEHYRKDILATDDVKTQIANT